MEAITSVMQRQFGPIQTREIGEEDCECGVRVKVREVSLRGKPHVHRVGCRCEELAEVRKILAENEAAKQSRIMNAFNRLSLINPVLQKAVFDNYEPKNQDMAAAKELAMTYVLTFSMENPKNILFTGDYGVGKSHLAAAIEKALMELGYTAIFITVPDFLTKLKSTFSNQSDLSEADLLEALKNVDVLVFDDLGAEYVATKKGEDPADSWAVTKMFEVVNARLGKHTIYTTNLNSKALQLKIGERNFSRICQNTHVMLIKGPDFRTKTMW